ncbi:MAG: 16S rRNA (uracil(1498)-N(3))-methyltransferase [Stomatobaculum sp.]|jgi:16S rRNA (uracil1498-N3)-methyltransferase|nr:16S rRNA (uracil(1498)-N(3))-methyltransferase [Stomatobaculum sp.]
MHHFFVRPEQISGKEAYIEGPDWNHAANVLRVRPGEQVLLSAGEDWDYLCTVREVDRAGQRVLLSVLEENRDIRELPVKISLYQGLPKSDKMELIIQKAVELGAARVIPVETARCVVKLDRKKAESKRSRWQAISESAAKQSGRSVIPEVAMPMPFAAALKEAADSDIRLIPYENAEGMERTRRILESVVPGQKIAVFIGPEGGFEETEIRQAEEAGFEAVTLGKRILRTETAGFVVLSLLMAQTEGK